jgi:hypothetical protein
VRYFLDRNRVLLDTSGRPPLLPPHADDADAAARLSSLQLLTMPIPMSPLLLPLFLPPGEEKERTKRREEEVCGGEEKGREETERERETREKGAVSLICSMRPRRFSLSAPQAARLMARSERCQLF